MMKYIFAFILLYIAFVASADLPVQQYNDCVNTVESWDDVADCIDVEVECCSIDGSFDFPYFDPVINSAELFTLSFDIWYPKIHLGSPYLPPQI